MAIAILGIVAAVIGQAFLVSAQTTQQTSQRFNESHDAQLASAYLANDVQSTVGLTPTSCGGVASLVNFNYPGNTGIASYIYTAAGPSGQLTRRFCSADGVTIANDSPLVDHAGSTTPPAVSCDGGPCSTGTTPRSVKIVVHDYNKVSQKDDFTYTLAGSVRAQQSGTVGTAVPHAALLTLGTAGNGVTMTGGSLSVNGNIVVNSSITHSGGIAVVHRNSIRRIDLGIRVRRRSQQPDRGQRERPVRRDPPVPRRRRLPAGQRTRFEHRRRPDSVGPWRLPRRHHQLERLLPAGRLRHHRRLQGAVRGDRAEHERRDALLRVHQLPDSRARRASRAGRSTSVRTGP